jgi:hypothetical protein
MMQFGVFAMILAALLILTAIPLAVVALRHEHREKRRALLEQIVTIAHEKAREATQTGEIMAITVPFIAENVKITKFGDKRRVTAPIAELLRPETGPIETLSYALKPPAPADDFPNMPEEAKRLPSAVVEGPDRW